MPKLSAGILMYRIKAGAVEVLLAHPGGPLFQDKDDGAWTIPKGEPEAGEELLAAARREFSEEIGFDPNGPFIALAPIQQKGGKIVHAWACEGDCDPSCIRSNSFSIEWPPKSGRRQTFPEVDRAEFFSLGEAKKRINPRQIPFLEELAALVGD